MRLISTIRLIIFSLLGLFLAACSSIPVSHDFDQVFDFSAYESFAWLANEDNEWGLTDNDLVDTRIRNAIIENLTVKEFIQVDSEKADFFVSYNVSVDQRVSTNNFSGGVSLGRSSRGRHGSIGISSGTQVQAYERGTLVIDVTDAASGALVWRGVSAQALQDMANPQRLTNKINETVAAIMAPFPPGIEKSK